MESLSQAGRFAVIGRRFNHARRFTDVPARFLGRPARSTFRRIRTGIGAMEGSALLSRDTPNKGHSTGYSADCLSLICHSFVTGPSLRKGATTFLRSTTHDAYRRETVICRFAECFCCSKLRTKSHASCPMHALSGSRAQVFRASLEGLGTEHEESERHRQPDDHIERETDRERCFDFQLINARRGARRRSWNCRLLLRTGACKGPNRRIFRHRPIQHRD